MRRRDLIAGLGGAAAWPVAGWGQQDNRVRRIGVLMPAFPERDPQAQLRVATLELALAKLGWIKDRNVSIDYRFPGEDIERARVFAAELVGRRPDVLIAGGTPAVAALMKATRTIPIVFHTIVDPIGQGFVTSLARPGGNVTGFIIHEPPLAGKWVQLLDKMAPALRRAAYIFNPDEAPFAGEFFRHAESAAAELMIEMIAAAVHNDGEIEDMLSALARQPNGGVVVDPDGFTAAHRRQIIAVTARYRLPAIYGSRYIVADGGLFSYGVDVIEPLRQTAAYVDRLLRGEKPADLPVQASTKYELVINLKTARAMGLDVSADMLSIANEVIE